MPNLTMMTQVNSTDPLNSGLGARKPRPDEIAKSAAESRAREAAEQRAYSFEKIVHATEKQMRQEAVGETAGHVSGSAPLGSATSSGSASGKLDAHGYFTHNYLVQAAAAEKMPQEIESWWEAAGDSVICDDWRKARLDPLNYAGTSTGRLSSSTPTAPTAPKADRIWPNDFKREINDPGCDLLGVFNNHFGLAARAESIVSLARMSKMSARDYLTSMAYDKTEGDKVWFSLPAGHRAFLRKQKVSPFDPER